MSTPEAVQAPARPDPLHCPRCANPLRDDQDWCLECGAPARTRLAPAPDWRVPAAVVVAVVVLAVGAFAFAFVRLTDDGGDPAPSSTVTQPGTAPIQPAPDQPAPVPGQTAPAPVQPGQPAPEPAEPLEPLPTP